MTVRIAENGQKPAGPPRNRPDIADSLRIAAEIFQRQVYFRSSGLMRIYGRWQNKSPRPPQQCHVAQLRERLVSIGVAPGALVMLHTSVGGISIQTDNKEMTAWVKPSEVANGLLSEVLALLGESGTLAMPTHPFYRHDPGFLGGDKPDLVLEYDPSKTRCKVGLANEIFRLMAGTERSLHPLQSVSVRGPKAAEILRNNLNRSKPLPHGLDSSYYRICQNRGRVLSFGIPLIEYLTILHTAEDFRDTEWPVRDFYRLRRFRVRIGDDWDEWTVRERRPLFARSYCEGQIHRDLLREGLLHEGYAGTIRMDWIDAADLLDYLLLRNKNNSYPYYFTGLAKLGG